MIGPTRSMLHRKACVFSKSKSFNQVSGRLLNPVKRNPALRSTLVLRGNRTWSPCTAGSLGSSSDKRSLRLPKMVPGLIIRC